MTSISSAGSATGCSRSAESSASRRSSPMTRTTPARATPRATTCCCASRRQDASGRRTGSGSRAAATTSSRPRRCTRLNSSDIWQEGCRKQPAADRGPGVDASGMFESSTSCRGFPSRRATRPRRSCSVPRCGRAWTGATRKATTSSAVAGRIRDPGHLSDGFPRLFPRGGGLHHVGEEQRRRGRPGPWLRGRLESSPTRWASPTSTRSTTA